MNKALYISALITLFSAALFVGCDSKKQEKDDASEAISDVKTDLQKTDYDTLSYADWMVFKTESEKMIDNNNQRIQEYQTKINKPGMPNLDKLREKRILELKDKNSALRLKIIEYKNRQTKSEWANFKDNFKRDLDTLSNSLDVIFKTDKSKK